MPDNDLVSDQFEYSPGEPRPPPAAKYDVPPVVSSFLSRSDYE